MDHYNDLQRVGSETSSSSLEDESTAGLPPSSTAGSRHRAQRIMEELENSSNSTAAADTAPLLGLPPRADSGLVAAGIIPSLAHHTMDGGTTMTHFSTSDRMCESTTSGSLLGWFGGGLTSSTTKSRTSYAAHGGNKPSAANSGSTTVYGVQRVSRIGEDGTGEGGDDAERKAISSAGAAGAACVLARTPTTLKVRRIFRSLSQYSSSAVDSSYYC